MRDTSISFLYEVFQTQCVIYIYGTSHFALDTCHMFSSHTWLISTKLDSVALADLIHALLQSSARLKQLRMYISNHLLF